MKKVKIRGEEINIGEDAYAIFTKIEDLIRKIEQTRLTLT